MPAELARFQNFAKLKDTEIAFNDITVLAGKPSTGKSYMMKFMYAINEGFFSIGQDIVNVKVSFNKFKKLEKDFSKYENGNKDKKNELAELRIELEKVLKLVEKNKTFSENPTFEEAFQNKLQNLLSSMFSNINQISNKFIVDLSQFSVEYDDSHIYVKNTNYSQDPFGNDFNNPDNEVIFVETPLILEFKKFMNHEKGKTPYHIESLLNILDTDYSFTDEEQDKFIKDFTQKSKEIIKGDIESSGDSFIFNQKGGQNYDILNASSGTKSIGLLQYLVTNKALKKGSVLYWEEPEVHLHPEWQLKMVELFVELMNAGVKIVFSTHSPYMCDYLNAISQKRKFADRVSFNLFKESDGVVDNHILKSDEEWNMIQAELLDPLEEIMWEYI